MKRHYLLTKEEKARKKWIAHGIYGKAKAKSAIIAFVLVSHTHINIQRKSEDVSGSRTFYYRGLPIQSMDVTLYNNIYINMYIVFEYKVVQTKISVCIPIGFVSSFLVYWQ